jgi:hypothetical protein
MGISTYRKTKIARASDYIFSSIPVFTSTVLSITNTSGKVNAIKIVGANTWNFSIEVDGVVETTSLAFNNSPSEQWIAPDLDAFISTPSNCNISFSNSFVLKVVTPLNATFQLHTHVEYDKEVSA